VLEAQNPPPVALLSSEDYITQEALKMGVDPRLALYVWTHEGQGNLTARGDLHLTCKRTGAPVNARGGWQITECYHPEVSDACADDLECSTKVAMPWLVEKKKCMQEFSTCRAYYRNQ